jgi:hypothetical protein
MCTGAERARWVPEAQLSYLDYFHGVTAGKLDGGLIHCRVTDIFNKVFNTYQCSVHDSKTGGKTWTIVEIN